MNANISKQEEEKRQERQDFFEAAIAAFFNLKENFGLKEVIYEKLSNRYKKNISVRVLEEAHKMINSYYWEIIDNQVRPLLAPVSQDEIIATATLTNIYETETIADVYKVLSVTEYAIMMVSPLLLSVDGKLIDYEKNIDLLQEELLLNAEFAFFCAFTLLSNWGEGEKGYKKFFQDEQVKEFLYIYKENGTEHRLTAMKLLEEHQAIIAFTNKNTTNLPIFSNAAWWRLFCLCGYLLNKPKEVSLHLSELKQKSKS